MMFTLVSLVSVILFVGCDSEVVEESVQTQSGVLAVSKKAGDPLPWEKVRYDYSYLETKVGESNQYLSKYKLRLDDLKQIHDIANLLFGEYRTALAKNWETRTPHFINSLMDKNLFYSRITLRNTLAYLYWSVKNREDIEKAPNVRIFTEHFAERGDYIFATVRFYSPGGSIAEKDDETWDYAVMQLKKDLNSPYGWKIFYVFSVSPWIFEDQPVGPWTIELNEQDDFSDEAWLKTQGVITDEEWETRFTRERDVSTRSIQQSVTRSNQSSQYNRQAAASYAYTYALNYNPNYYFWNDERNTDCANFASQCLAAGGLPQDATWRYFYNTRDPYSSATSAWRGAKQLYDYLLKDPSRATTVPIQYMIDAYNQKKDAWCVLRWGDLVFTNRNASGSLKHAMIITHSYNDLSKYYNGTPRYTLSAHTNDKRDVDLREFDLNYLRQKAVGVKIEY